MDKGLYTGIILLDLQKAFDTVDHKILTTKLLAIGCDSNTVKWFSCYLNNRKQFVDVNNSFSSLEPVTCGVPQGSILGPLLFTIYVNDMCTSVTCDLCLYADDSMLIVSGKNVVEIEKSLTVEMNDISDWLTSNKLSLHLGKTETILCASKKKLKKNSKLNITCNGIQLEAKSKVKYLGAVIDQDLSGTSMAVNIIKKVNGGLKFLYRKKNLLNFKCRKLLCAGMLQCRFDYAYNVYYRGITCTLKKKLQTAENKIIRFILNYDSRRHLYVSDFKKVKYLDIETRMQYLTLNMMYNIFYGYSPEYLCDFLKVTDVHCHRTRFSNLSYAITSVNSHGKRSFKYNGAFLWNQLPVSIRMCESKDNFKAKCKKHLYENMLASEQSDYVYY